LKKVKKIIDRKKKVIKQV